MEWSLYVTAIGVLEKGVRGFFSTFTRIICIFIKDCSMEAVGDSISSPYTGKSPSLRQEGVAGMVRVSNASWSHG